MPIVAPEQLKKMEQDQFTIKKVLGGWKGPLLEHVYDDRSECWRENIAEAERRRLERDGKNIHMQTPSQVKAFQIKQREQLEKKKRAELAAEMANQNK